MGCVGLLPCFIVPFDSNRNHMLWREHRVIFNKTRATDWNNKLIRNFISQLIDRGAEGPFFQRFLYDLTFFSTKGVTLLLYITDLRHFSTGPTFQTWKLHPCVTSIKKTFHMLEGRQRVLCVFIPGNTGYITHNPLAHCQHKNNEEPSISTPPFFFQTKKRLKNGVCLVFCNVYWTVKLCSTVFLQQLTENIWKQLLEGNSPLMLLLLLYCYLKTVQIAGILQLSAFKKWKMICLWLKYNEE